MTLESVSWLSEKTGFTRETIVKRLKNANIDAIPGPKMATMYETKTAFPVLYGQAEGGEQGALMKSRIENLDADTRLKAIKEQELLGQLAPVDILEWALASICSQIGATLETLPAKLKRRLPQLNAADLEIIRKEIAKTRNSAAAVRLDLGDHYRNTDQQGDSASPKGARATTPVKIE